MLYTRMVLINITHAYLIVFLKVLEMIIMRQYIIFVVISDGNHVFIPLYPNLSPNPPPNNTNPQYTY